MKKIRFFIILIFQSLCLFANESGYQKIDFTISPNVSINGLFFAEINKEKNITVCYEKETRKEIWTINENFKSIYITNDGKIGIGIYQVLDQKNLNTIKNQNAIAIFRNGKKIKELKVKDILKKVFKGKKNGLEFYWGNIENIFDEGFIINTPEGFKVFNYSRNDFISPDDDSLFTKWKYEELFDYSLRLDSSEICEYYNFMKVQDSEPPYDKISFSYVGKYNEGIAAPAEIWDIDENGYLLIGLDEDFKYVKVLKKIYIDKKNFVAYLVQNNIILRYRYNIRDW